MEISEDGKVWTINFGVQVKNAYTNNEALYVVHYKAYSEENAQRISHAIDAEGDKSVYVVFNDITIEAFDSGDGMGGLIHVTTDDILISAYNEFGTVSGVVFGNLGSNAEIKQVGSGENHVAEVRMAINKYKGKSVPPETMWVKLSIWGKNLKVLESRTSPLTKGTSLIVMFDALSVGVWKDKTSGEVKGSLEVRFDKYTFAGGKKSDDEKEEATSSGAKPAAKPAPKTNAFGNLGARAKITRG
jgi:single-stranded DNA-binding protein